MIRNLKTLGLALCAALALTAVMASAASATGTYTSSQYPTTGTATSASGNDTFTTEAGTFECNTHFEGSLNAPSSHLRIKVTHTECRFSIFTVAVHTNGCEYTFETPAKVSVDNYTAPVQVVCPAGKVIQITTPAGSPFCEITVAPQTPAGSVAIVDNTATGDVALAFGLTGINYTVTKDGFGCPYASLGPKTGARHTQHNPITFDAVNPAAASIQVSG